MMGLTSTSFADLLLKLRLRLHKLKSAGLLFPYNFFLSLLKSTALQIPLRESKATHFDSHEHVREAGMDLL